MFGEFRLGARAGRTLTEEVGKVAGLIGDGRYDGCGGFGHEPGYWRARDRRDARRKQEATPAPANGRGPNGARTRNRPRDVPVGRQWPSAVVQSLKSPAAEKSSIAGTTSPQTAVVFKDALAVASYWVTRAKQVAAPGQVDEASSRVSVRVARARG
jgi:hypothetical protein